MLDRPHHVLLYCADRNPEAPGDFLVAQPFDAPEHEDGLGSLRQDFERCTYRSKRGTRLKNPIGCDLDTSAFDIQIGHRPVLTSSLTTTPVDQNAGGHLEGVCLKIIDRLGSGARRQPEKNLLHEIRNVVLICDPASEVPGQGASERHQIIRRDVVSLVRP